MDRILDIRRPSQAPFRALLGESKDANPHILSSIPRSIIDVAKHLKGRELAASTRILASSVELIDPMMGFIISKNNSHARFYSDREMLCHSGGSWFINEVRRRLMDRLDPLYHLGCPVEVAEVQANSTSFYHFCVVSLGCLPRTPQPLLIVRKAMLLRLMDDIIEGIHREVD